MTAVHVSLREWEILSPANGSPLAHRILGGDTERQLAKRLTTTGRIEVLELARGIELRATSFVGRFRLDDITVTVHPKISGAPLLTLLRYAYGLRDLHLYEAVGYTVAEWTFQELLVRQLIAEVSELLARGIHRDYERTHAELEKPRGRIEFNRLAGATFQAKPVLPCVFYPRTDDTILNQVVLSGLMYAAALAIDADMHAHIRGLTQRLAQTVSIKKLDTMIIMEAIESIDRRTNAYKPALLLVDLLFHSHGVLLDGESTRISLPGFLFDMNRFFQTLISRFLHDHLDGFEIQDEYRLKELFYYDPYRNPLRRRAPVQKPDFVIRHGRRIAAILDAKYRVCGRKRYLERCCISYRFMHSEAASIAGERSSFIRL